MTKRFTPIAGRSLEAFEDNERALALYRACPDPDDGVLRVESWALDDGPRPDLVVISGRLRRAGRVAGFRHAVSMAELRDARAGVREAIAEHVGHLIHDARTMLDEPHG